MIKFVQTKCNLAMSAPHGRDLDLELILELHVLEII